MNKKIRTLAVALLLSVMLFMQAGCDLSTVFAPADTVEPPVTATQAPEQTPDEPVDTPKPAEPDNQDAQEIEIPDPETPLVQRPAFEIPMPVASGAEISDSGRIVVDYSNARDGYIMITSAPDVNEPLVRITAPGGAVYQYHLRTDGEYDVYPLSDGNGPYSVAVFEKVSGNKYTPVGSADVSVTLTDEFAPFIRPNHFVNYNPGSNVVKKSNELVSGASDAFECITAVYDFVVQNFTYDDQFASAVQSGQIKVYVPEVDAVLAAGKGICFDYAAVTVAMLRSQGIPSKLVVGYAGQIYHAWINVYTEEEGWVDAVHFSGRAWTLMDPTFDSTGGGEFVGDGSNYEALFVY